MKKQRVSKELRKKAFGHVYKRFDFIGTKMIWPIMDKKYRCFEIDTKDLAKIIKFKKTF